MTIVRAQFWAVVAAAVWLSCVSSLRADFVIDTFVIPTHIDTNASYGQSATGPGILNGNRLCNVTAGFDVLVAKLDIVSGSLTFAATPNGASPTPSLTLSYTAPAPFEDVFAQYERVLLRDVVSDSAWTLMITLTGASPTSQSISTTVIPAGQNGDYSVPLGSFDNITSFGLLSGIELKFSNTTAGQFSFGTLSIAAVPEPALLGFGAVALGAIAGWRRKRNRKRIAMSIR